jgi:hypothetical protein
MKIGIQIDIHAGSTNVFCRISRLQFGHFAGLKNTPLKIGTQKRTSHFPSFLHLITKSEKLLAAKETALEENNNVRIVENVRFMVESGRKNQTRDPFTRLAGPQPSGRIVPPSAATFLSFLAN